MCPLQYYTLDTSVMLVLYCGILKESSINNMDEYLLLNIMNFGPNNGNLLYLESSCIDYRLYMHMY